MNNDAKYDYWEKLSQDERNGDIRWRFFGDQSEDDGDWQPTAALDCIPILDHGYVALIDHMGTDVDIVNAARKSFNKEVSSLDEKDRQLLRYLWKNRHTSPFEMVELKFSVMAPMFVARQWMRHRTWSYNEVSRRYTADRLRFYTPDQDHIRKQSESDRQASTEWGDDDGGSQFMAMLEFTEVAYKGEDVYHSLLEKGVCREQARMVLPQNLYVEFVAKTNLNNLLHFLDLRMDSHAQWEMQQYAEGIAEMLENVVPETMTIYRESRDAKKI